MRFSTGCFQNGDNRVFGFLSFSFVSDNAFLPFLEAGSWSRWFLAERVMSSIFLIVHTYGVREKTMDGRGFEDFVGFKEQIHFTTVRDILTWMAEQGTLFVEDIKNPEYDATHLSYVQFPTKVGGFVSMTTEAAQYFLNVLREDMQRPEEEEEVTTGTTTDTKPLGDPKKSTAYKAFLEGLGILQPFEPELQVIGITPLQDVRDQICDDHEWQDGHLHDWAENRREAWDKASEKARQMVRDAQPLSFRTCPALLKRAAKNAFDTHVLPLMAVWLQGYVFRAAAFPATLDSIIASVHKGQDRLKRQQKAQGQTSKKPKLDKTDKKARGD